MAQILTRKQESALALISKTSLAQEFYFSGGTALAHHYLQHRKSEDLDFFNFQEFDPKSVTVCLKSLKNKLGYASFDYQNSMNRNLYFLKFDDDNYTLKLEFTYYPFVHIKEPLQIDGLKIDSLIDIAANKLLTIVQNPRGRDFYDLYYIEKDSHFSIEKLRMLAKQKFDWHIDPLQLAARFNDVDLYLDDPILIDHLDKEMLFDYFKNEADKLKGQIVE